MTSYVTLNDLPGIRRKSARALMVRTVTGAMKGLRSKVDVITAAGDLGAINAYRDDAGQYRAQFMQHCVIRDEGTFKTKTALREWLASNWKWMRP